MPPPGGCEPQASPCALAALRWAAAWLGARRALPRRTNTQLRACPRRHPLPPARAATAGGCTTTDARASPSTAPWWRKAPSSAWLTWRRARRGQTEAGPSAVTHGLCHARNGPRQAPTFKRRLPHTHPQVVTAAVDLDEVVSCRVPLPSALSLEPLPAPVPGGDRGGGPGRGGVLPRGHLLAARAGVGHARAGAGRGRLCALQRRRRRRERRGAVAAD